MSNTLSDLSRDLASAVERAASCVVAVHGRPRISASGIVWRPGLVLTADAALRREEDIRVTLPDGTTTSATLKGRDASTDLALLACDTGAATPAVFTTNAAKVGHIVVTAGRTTDTGPIATMGMVSGVSGEWQAWRGGKLDEFVRLDISLYPTSVGGAVADPEGNLLGMVAAGLSRSSVLVITRATIERVAQALLTKGRISRGYLGIGLQPVAIPESVKQQLKISQNTGIMALNVADDGPGARAGMLMGDVILSLGGREIPSVEALHAALDPSTVGKELPLSILRGGAPVTLSVTVAERPI